MLILGYLGSSRVRGNGSSFLDAFLEGAASCGAETRRINIARCDIQFCTGCCSCLHSDPDLAVGTCPLNDEMASLLEEYISADGYVFVSPNYDGYITALMKRFIERKIALTYRPKDAYATIGSARSPADFKKKASMIVTANCPDEYREVMGDPCFEALEGHLMIEQVETVDKLYIGGVENMTPDYKDRKKTEAFQAGARMVAEIEKARQ